jgi:divalent metal cation (Fe/Co/Zn/Cd) transporter
MEKAALDHLKAKTARVSVISGSGLVLMKFIIGFAIGSVSIISETIRSSMDLIAAGHSAHSMIKVRKQEKFQGSPREYGRTFFLNWFLFFS